MTAVKCWGLNNNGQLGNNSITNSPFPVDVSGLSSGIKAITSGYFFSCALTTGGGVLCWGDNGNGQIGNNTTTRAMIPVSVSGLSSGVAAISAGGFHVCALLTNNGAVKCWGFNYYGEL